jgi:hypothetical protein
MNIGKQVEAFPKKGQTQLLFAQLLEEKPPARGRETLAALKEMGNQFAGSKFVAEGLFGITLANAIPNDPLTTKLAQKEFGMRPDGTLGKITPENRKEITGNAYHI